MKSWITPLYFWGTAPQRAKRVGPVATMLASHLTQKKTLEDERVNLQAELDYKSERLRQLQVSLAALDESIAVLRGDEFNSAMSLIDNLELEVENVVSFPIERLTDD